ncbi:SH3 domain-containing protein [Caldimonas brevitalea]|nr:SH3 domain-containing protein [Caldimonas brevitalea]
MKDDAPLQLWPSRNLPAVAIAALILTTLECASAVAVPPAQPPRWVTADDVRVRTGPSPEHKVSGTLLRGAELILKSPTEISGFCLIEGQGQYGYVACKYLGTERIARRKAGEDGVDAAQRWVSGNGVTLREAPRLDAPVLARLALNTTVKLVREEAEGGYCEVQVFDGPIGFTACRYLTFTPVDLARIRGDRSADLSSSPDYDPERVFWLEPGWNALEAYADYLQKQQPGIPPEGPWPRDDGLERMKEHLALGLKGRKPAPYADWADLKRKASQNLDLGGEAGRLQAEGKNVSDEVWQRELRMNNIGHELQNEIGLWEPMQDPTSNENAAAPVIRLVRALEFPVARPSLFRSEADVAPPKATAEEGSGRFGIVFRQLFTSRQKRKREEDEVYGAGLYDMLARTQLLVRPVQRVQLFRDGRLQVEASLMRKSETLWRDVDEPMCRGWVPGFSYGAADPLIWRYFDAESPVEGSAGASESSKLNRNPPGTLFAFYASIDLPPGPAIRTETHVRLDRAATGFVRGVHLHYDLDGDHVPDIAVWEGQGRGPGHLGGTTTTDDRWYRLALVNINGAWKVLGSDVFSYGCGC